MLKSCFFKERIIFKWTEYLINKEEIFANINEFSDLRKVENIIYLVKIRELKIAVIVVYEYENKYLLLLLSPTNHLTNFLSVTH